MHARLVSAPKPGDGLFNDRYLILRELGRGGMGTVELAFQTDLERHVALKRILPESVGLASAEGWFRREYRALAAIRHPGVPVVYDCGKRDELVAYFTMEIIEGASLRATLDAGTYTPVEALGITIELAKILAAAHDVGVVHRDVKPSNIVLEVGGRLRLIDFGICFFLPTFRTRLGNLRSVKRDEHQTGPLEFAGTVGYTDPALREGHPVQVQSDIFSVAAILYEMLTGRRLYDERAGRFQTIDSGEFAPELARVVAEVRRGCERVPGDRHTSMSEFIRALEIARSGLLRARNKPPRGRAVVFALSLTNALVLAALAGLWISGHLVVNPDPHAPPPAVETPAEPEPPEPPAEVEPTRVEPAEMGPQTSPGPAGRTKAPPRSRPAPQALTQALVSELTTPSAGALRECLAKSGPMNLEVTVEAGRALLTRVEWLPYDPEDETERCLARVLAAIQFPRAPPAGPFRLKIEG